MKKLGSVLVAYIIASVMVVILAWVGKGIFDDVTGWRMDTSRRALETSVVFSVGTTVMFSKQAKHPFLAGIMCAVQRFETT